MKVKMIERNKERKIIDIKKKKNLRNFKLQNETKRNELKGKLILTFSNYLFFAVIHRVNKIHP